MEKVKTLVLKISPNTKEKMIEYFEDKKRDKTPPYAVFQADEADTVVTMYESNKVVFQGISADIDANMWNEMEKHLNNKDGLIEQKKKDKQEQEQTKKIPIRINSIGSDEVGTGDYFGPIIVTASYVNTKDIDFLLELKIKDSKKLTDEEITKIAPIIINKIKHHTIVLNNTDYNKYHQNNINMNKMKAILHNKALYEIVKDTNQYDYIVVDQFAKPKNYFDYIKEAKYQVKNITFLTKAEDQCLSVAVSSIISRYYFIKEIDKMSNDLGIQVLKGASNLVDKVAIEVIKKYGKDKLKEVVKLNFKNTEKIINN